MAGVTTLSHELAQCNTLWQPDFSHSMPTYAHAIERNPGDKAARGVLRVVAHQVLGLVMAHLSTYAHGESKALTAVPQNLNHLSCPGALTTAQDLRNATKSWARQEMRRLQWDSARVLRITFPAKKEVQAILLAKRIPRPAHPLGRLCIVQLDEVLVCLTTGNLPSICNEAAGLPCAAGSVAPTSLRSAGAWQTRRWLAVQDQGVGPAELPAPSAAAPGTVPA